MELEELMKKLPNGSYIMFCKGEYSFYDDFRDVEDFTWTYESKPNETFTQFIERIIKEQ